MALVKDWAVAAAEELVDVDLNAGLGGRFRKTAVAEALDIIVKHSPYKQDTAYMPVPRCDVCMHWDKDVIEPTEGSCLLMFEADAKVWPDYRDGINTKADFGCVQWKEKT